MDLKRNTKTKRAKPAPLPAACPICREVHAPDRGLSYDGIGVNSCCMYRTRIATLPKLYRHLGPVLAAAPELLKAARAAMGALLPLAQEEQGEGRKGIAMQAYDALYAAVGHAKGAR